MRSMTFLVFILCYRRVSSLHPPLAPSLPVKSGLLAAL